MVARTDLTAGTGLATASTYNTGMFTATSGQLVLTFVTSIGNGGAPAGIPTVTGNNLTWAQVESIELPGPPHRRLTCFRAMGLAPVAGVLTFNFGGALQALCAWSVFEYANVNSDGIDGSGAVVQFAKNSSTGTTLQVLLANPLLDPGGSAVVGAIIVAAPVTVSPAATLTQIDRQPFAKGVDTGALQTEERIGGSQTVAWYWAGSAAAAGIAVEIKPDILLSSPPPPDDPETLARRFEPVLFFHPSELFFPSNAKNYVEQCALWRAENSVRHEGFLGWQGITLPTVAGDRQGKHRRCRRRTRHAP